MNCPSADFSNELERERSRHDAYELFMRFFKVEISQDLFACLQGNDLLTFDNATKRNENVEMILSGLHLMKSYFVSDGASKLDLDRDYAKVFCGAGSTNCTAAYPFESLYTSKERLLMQEARDSVLKWYARHGLGKASSWKDCEDHLAVELEFLVYLIGESIAALEKGDIEWARALAKEQQGFMAEHLVNWVPTFATQVVKHARTDFYQGAALMLEGYLLSDFSEIQAIGVTEPRES